MFFEEMLKCAKIKKPEEVSKEDVVLLPASIRPDIDYSMVIEQIEFEELLVNYRTKEPFSEVILFSLGKSGMGDIDLLDPIWSCILKSQLVQERYSSLCNEKYLQMTVENEINENSLSMSQESYTEEKVVLEEFDVDKSDKEEDDDDDTVFIAPNIDVDELHNDDYDNDINSICKEVKDSLSDEEHIEKIEESINIETCETSEKDIETDDLIGIKNVESIDNSSDETNNITEINDNSILDTVNDVFNDMINTLEKIDIHTLLGFVNTDSVNLYNILCNIIPSLKTYAKFFNGTEDTDTWIELMDIYKEQVIELQNDNDIMNALQPLINILYEE